jgi:hypothetical protein
VREIFGGRETAYSAGGLFGIFGSFGSIFEDFGHFEAHFSVFRSFETCRDVSHANENRPCTYTHPETSTRYRNWAPELPGFFIFVQSVDLSLKPLFCWVQWMQDTVASTHHPGGALVVLTVRMCTRYSLTPHFLEFSVHFLS